MRNSESIIFRQAFHGSDISKLIHLTESTYPGEDISDEDYLSWEYEKNPGGKAKIFVAEKESTIISQYILLPRTYCIHKKIINGSLSVNTLTHPDFKGRNLFASLAEKTFIDCKSAGIEFTVGFPNKKSFPVFTSKLKFKSLGRLPFLMLPLRSLGIIISLMKGLGEKKGEEIILGASNVSNNGSVSISDFDLSLDANLYSEFMGNFKNEKMIFLNRSIEFLRWRYIEIPRRRYRLLKMVQDNRMIAYAIVRAKHLFGLRCGILMDFCTNPYTDRMQTSSLFLSSIKKFGKMNNLDLLITSMQKSSAEYKLLRNSGFFKMPDFILPQQLEFILRVHNDSNELNELGDFEKWFLTFGDYDVF